MRYLILLLPLLLFAEWSGDTMKVPYIQGGVDTTHPDFQAYITNHAGGGDMSKSTYDTDADDSVNVAEASNLSVLADSAKAVTVSKITGTKLDDFATPDDNTDLNATTGHHGLLLKLGGGTTNFLRADGSWAEPPGGGTMSGSAIMDSINNLTQIYFGDTVYLYNPATNDTVLFAYVDADGILHVGIADTTIIDTAFIRQHLYIPTGDHPTTLVNELKGDTSGADSLWWSGNCVFPQAAGSGDMLKSTYDTDEDDSVDVAEASNLAVLADSAKAVTISKITGTKLDDFATPDDNTDLNVSTSAHGLAPKLSNVSTEYLSGTGVYSTPAGGGGGYESDTFVINLNPYWNNGSQIADSINHQFVTNTAQEQMYTSLGFELPVLIDTHRVIIDTIRIYYWTNDLNDSLKFFFLKREMDASDPPVRVDSTAKVGGVNGWQNINILPNGSYTVEDGYSHYIWMRGDNDATSGIRIQQAIRVVYHAVIE